MQETLVRSLGREDPLEKGKATHSSILAWRIRWTEEPQSVGWQRVGPSWAAHTCSFIVGLPCCGSFRSIAKQICLFSMSVSLFRRWVHLCPFFRPTCKWCHDICLSVSSLPRLAWSSLGPGCCKWPCFVLFFFYGWVVFHCVCICVCMYTLRLLSPFSRRWTPRLFPYLGYCK